MFEESVCEEKRKERKAMAREAHDAAEEGAGDKARVQKLGC